MSVSVRLMPDSMTVDWSSLFDAYGPATDSPAALAALTSRDEGMRREALEHLFSALLHQGSVYPATAPALRIVAGLLDTPAARQSDGNGGTILAALLEFIEGCAEAVLEAADADLEPEEPVDPVKAEEFLKRIADDPENYDLWESPVVDHMMVAALAELRSTCIAITPAVVPLLTDEDLATREAAGKALTLVVQIQPPAWPHAGAVVHELAMRTAPDEADRDTRSRLVYAVGRTGGDCTPWLTDEDEAVRACAALWLPDSREATAVLVRALTNPRAIEGWFTQPAMPYRQHVRRAFLDALLDRAPSWDVLRPAALALTQSANWSSAPDDVVPVLWHLNQSSTTTPAAKSRIPSELARAVLGNGQLWEARTGLIHPVCRDLELPAERDVFALLSVSDAPTH